MDESWIQSLIVTALRTKLRNSVVEEFNTSTDVEITAPDGKRFLVQVTEMD
jgi:hypothetical protein